MNAGIIAVILVIVSRYATTPQAVRIPPAIFDIFGTLMLQHRNSSILLTQPRPPLNLAVISSADNDSIGTVLATLLR